MPNLKHLIEHGVMGNLATLYPVLSPMLWTSIAAGKRARKHGIHGFAEPDPASGGARTITNLGRKTKAVWNILNQPRPRSNVIGWWPSYRCEPINGVMVSDHFKDHQAVYFEAIDHFCHGFMRYHPPRGSWVNEADFALCRDVVNSGYRFDDLAMAAAAEPNLRRQRSGEQA